MINNIKYFFRGSPDGYSFPMMSNLHLLILMFTLLGCILIISKGSNLRDSKYSRYFKAITITILSIQQIVLYIWYMFSGYFTIKESLPLYNCRIAIIFTIFAFITNKNIFKNVCCYWGFAGSILALLFPVTDPFNFPHYTLISFWSGHIVMLWATTYLLFVERYSINKNSLRSMLIFTNIYNLIIYKFNQVFLANYCYLNEPPFEIKFISNINPYTYTLIIFATFNLVMTLFYICAKGLSKNHILENNESRVLFDI